MSMLLKMSELETERLQLRAFRDADLTGVADWEGIQHAETFLEFCFRSYREWGMGPWAMLLKESGVIAGNCGFCRIRYDRDGPELEYSGDVNYYVAQQYRGQGLATEALRVVLQFGFNDLRLTRIQGQCDPGNVSSERVMQKAGLKFERMIAGRTIAGQMPAGAGEASPEEKLYAISREDFQALRSAAGSGAGQPQP
jgi:[ribosomal protein S5]-alanine N-acetyltransferase